jgi:xylulokinase
VLEGVAFNLYTGLRAFIENGTDVSSIGAIGGAANSDLLLQIMADVWGVPVTRRDLVDEATAVGAAVVGGVGVGMFADFEVSAGFSRALRTLTPEEGGRERYARCYELFLEAYQRLEPWFDKL